MSVKKLWILTLAAILLLSGCGVGGEEQEDEGDAQVSDLPATGLGIRNAQNFDIQYLADGVKLLTDSAGRELLLVPEGGKAPAGYDDALLVRTPVKRAMYTSTTHVGFLGALEEDSLYDSIAAVTTEASQWSTPQVADRFANGQITYIVQDSWTAGDVESIVATAPDLVFTDMSSEGGTALCTMLDQLAIPYVVVAENQDTGSEAYLEWLKFFGAFYNLDEKADSLYEEKLDHLEELYRKVRPFQRRTALWWPSAWSLMASYTPRAAAPVLLSSWIGPGRYMRCRIWRETAWCSWGWKNSWTNAETRISSFMTHCLCICRGRCWMKTRCLRSSKPIRTSGCIPWITVTI